MAPAHWAAPVWSLPRGHGGENSAGRAGPWVSRTGHGGRPRASLHQIGAGSPSQVHSDGEPGQADCDGLRGQSEPYAGEPVAGSAIQGHRCGSPGAEPAGSGDSAPGWWSSTTAAATPLKGIGNRFRPSCRESLLPAAHRGKLAILISRIAREEGTVLRHPIDQPDTADCRPGDRQHRGAVLVLGPGGRVPAGERPLPRIHLALRARGLLGVRSAGRSGSREQDGGCAQGPSRREWSAPLALPGPRGEWTGHAGVAGEAHAAACRRCPIIALRPPDDRAPPVRRALPSGEPHPR